MFNNFKPNPNNIFVNSNGRVINYDGKRKPNPEKMERRFNHDKKGGPMAIFEDKKEE